MWLEEFWGKSKQVVAIFAQMELEDEMEDEKVLAIGRGASKYKGF